MYKKDKIIRLKTLLEHALESIEYERLKTIEGLKRPDDLAVYQRLEFLRLSIMDIEDELR